MNYLRHFWMICRHKYYVGRECFKHGMYWQGIVHDLSKFSSVEFFTSARYFQGDKTPVGAEKAARDYSIAWLNHKAKNKHHWEYWIDFKDGVLYGAPMPEKYIAEMVCDMIGAAKSYGGGTATEYYEKHKHKWVIDPWSRFIFEKLLKLWDTP